MPEPLNLIEKALQYAREARQRFEQTELGIIEPLTPQARRSAFYLRVRENIAVGCRKAVKLLTVPHKRSIAYSILMQACINIFHYGNKDKMLALYNPLLDEMIGTH